VELFRCAKKIYLEKLIKLIRILILLPTSCYFTLYKLHLLIDCCCFFGL